MKSVSSPLSLPAVLTVSHCLPCLSGGQPLCSQHPHYPSCSSSFFFSKREHPCCRTIAEMHSCKSQTRNGSPVVAEFVI